MAEPGQGRPASMSMYYLDQYYLTHEQRMEKSIALAQAELQTRLKLLQYYDRQLKALDDKQSIITKTKEERNKTVTKTTSVDQFKREMEVAKQEDKRAEARARAEQRAEESVNADFDIARFDVGGIGKNMEDDLRAGADQALALDRAIARVGGQSAGSSPLQRIILGKALLLQMDRAKRVVGGRPFDRNDAKASIASQLGISLSDIDVPDTTLRRREVAARTRAPQFTADIPGTDQPGGVSTTVTRFPGEKETTTKTTKDGKTPQDIYDEDTLKQIAENRKRIEQMKADVMTAIERDTGTDLDFERLIERGRDIYRRQYAPMSKEQKRAVRQKELISGLSPTQKQMYQAYNKWKSERASISPDELETIRDTMNRPPMDSDSDTVKLAKQIMDQRKQGVEFPNGVYEHIQSLVIPGSGVDPDEIASYLIIAKRKPLKAPKTIDQELDEIIKGAPEKATQTFDALKALQDGMKAEQMTPEQQKILVEQLQAQGIDAKTLLETPKEVEKPFIDIPQDILGGAGQSQTDMGKFYSSSPTLASTLYNLPANIRDALQWLEENTNIMQPGPPDMFTPTIPPKGEEEEEKEQDKTLWNYLEQEKK